MYDVKVYSLAAEGGRQVTPHFKVREFACNDGSDPVFISQALADILENIRVHFGKPVHINSGYRTVSYNKTVSGTINALSGKVELLLNNLEDFKQRYKETLEELKETDRHQDNQLNDHEHRITQLEAKCKEREEN